MTLPVESQIFVVVVVGLLLLLLLVVVVCGEVFEFSLHCFGSDGCVLTHQTFLFLYLLVVL